MFVYKYYFIYLSQNFIQFCELSVNVANNWLFLQTLENIFNSVNLKFIFYIKKAIQVKYLKVCQG